MEVVVVMSHPEDLTHRVMQMKMQMSLVITQKVHQLIPMKRVLQVRRTTPAIIQRLWETQRQSVLHLLLYQLPNSLILTIITTLLFDIICAVPNVRVI